MAKEFLPHAAIKLHDVVDSDQMDAQHGVNTLPDYTAVQAQLHDAVRRIIDIEPDQVLGYAITIVTKADNFDAANNVGDCRVSCEMIGAEDIRHIIMQAVREGYEREKQPPEVEEFLKELRKFIDHANDDETH